MLKNLFSDDGAFFSKSPVGDEVFYPWGGAGERYRVNAHQKHKILVAIYAEMAAFICLTAIVFIYFDLTNRGLFSTTWVITIPVTVYMFAYCIRTYLQTRGLIPHEVKGARDEKSKKPRVLKALMIIGLLQLFYLFLGLLYNPNDFLIMIAIFYVVVLYPSLIAFIFYRKGYIFQSSQYRSSV